MLLLIVFIINPNPSMPMLLTFCNKMKKVPKYKIYSHKIINVNFHNTHLKISLLTYCQNRKIC